MSILNILLVNIQLTQLGFKYVLTWKGLRQYSKNVDNFWCFIIKVHEMKGWRATYVRFVISSHVILPCVRLSVVSCCHWL